VLGLADADHEETSPDAPTLLITKLSCSLVGKKEAVRLEPGTQTHRMYGAGESIEDFACNYGFNPLYLDHFLNSGLRVSGTDAEGVIRTVELPGHPFFVATLYLPQMKSAPGKPHPLIAAFVKAAIQSKTGATTVSA
jgi:CTP synthase (UTP-ammonia lyase)